MPVLASISEKYSPQDIVIITVSVGGSIDETRQVVESQNLDLITLFDESRGVKKLYSVRGKPHIYLIDQDGLVSYSQIGLSDRSEPELQQEIEKVYPH